MNISNLGHTAPTPFAAGLDVLCDFHTLRALRRDARIRTVFSIVRLKCPVAVVGVKKYEKLPKVGVSNCVLYRNSDKFLTSYLFYHCM